MPGGNKTFYTIGGMGTKPDKDYSIIDPGKFTKAERGHKAILSTQTRLNKSMKDRTLRNLTQDERDVLDGKVIPVVKPDLLTERIQKS